MIRARVMNAALIAIAISTPARAQEETLPGIDAIPFEIRFAIDAVDTILSSGQAVGLEAFAADTVTGVYLHGSLGEKSETIGYGRNAVDRHYLWFSIDHGLNVEYVAMLFDIDADLTPDFLLFRTIDRKRNFEYAVEYRSPPAMNERFDIAFDSACKAPTCDPAFWTVRPRTTTTVSGRWFDSWRPLFALAAARGERWIGRSRSDLAARSDDRPRP